MAVCLVVQMPGVDAKQYDAVMKRLDFAGKGRPKGAISHVAGPTPDGWCSVDVWESQSDFEAFFMSRLGPAMAEEGLASEPHFMTFTVHSSYGPG